jgi:hypothetical protein
MKYTLDQLELIAIMFQIQFGDKTFREIFPKLKYTKHEGTINELTINHNDGDVNFLLYQNLVAYFCLRRYVFVIFGDENPAVGYHTKIEEIVKMLNFNDKV